MPTTKTPLTGGLDLDMFPPHQGQWTNTATGNPAPILPSYPFGQYSIAFFHKASATAPLQPVPNHLVPAKTAIRLGAGARSQPAGLKISGNAVSWLNHIAGGQTPVHIEVEFQGNWLPPGVQEIFYKVIATTQ